MNNYFLSIMLISLSLLSSCSSISVREFFVKPGVLQYFINDIEFKGNNHRTVIDITFRNDPTEEYVLLNFFLYFDKNAIKTVKHVTFHADGKSFHVTKLKFLFSKLSERYLRYTSSITPDELKLFLHAKSLKMEIKTERSIILLKFSNHQMNKKIVVGKDIFYKTPSE